MDFDSVQPHKFNIQHDFADHSSNTLVLKPKMVHRHSFRQEYPPTSVSNARGCYHRPFKILSNILSHRYLQELEHSDRLNIIVFDEVHKVLTDSDYRDPFKSFSVLNLVKTILVSSL